MTSQSASTWTLPAIVLALRDATREAHERLDAAIPVLTPGLGLAAYHELLGRYLVAHRAVESALDQCASALARVGVTLDERRKVPLLERDRAYVASLLVSNPDDVMPNAPFTLATPSAAWGALYVVEGSTLGGQHILRSLQSSELVRRHGLTSENGLAYFTGYGDRTATMWRQFLTALGDADAVDPGERGAIIHAAQATFALFERVLTQ